MPASFSLLFTKIQLLTSLKSHFWQFCSQWIRYMYLLYSHCQYLCEWVLYRWGLWKKCSPVDFGWLHSPCVCMCMYRFTSIGNRILAAGTVACSNRRFTITLAAAIVDMCTTACSQWTIVLLQAKRPQSYKSHPYLPAHVQKGDGGRHSSIFDKDIHFHYLQNYCPQR